MAAKVADRVARLASQLPAATRSVTVCLHWFTANPHGRQKSTKWPVNFVEVTKYLVILAQATKIATCEMTLRAIRAQKIAAIERMRERYAAPLCKKDNSLDLAKARSMEGWLADKELQSRLPKVLEKYKEKIVPVVKGEKTPSKLASTHANSLTG